jgi:hypothetical protein
LVAPLRQAYLEDEDTVPLPTVFYFIAALDQQKVEPSHDVWVLLASALRLQIKHESIDFPSCYQIIHYLRKKMEEEVRREGFDLLSMPDPLVFAEFQEIFEFFEDPAGIFSVENEAADTDKTWGNVNAELKGLKLGTFGLCKSLHPQKPQTSTTANRMNSNALGSKTLNSCNSTTSD